MDAIGSGIQEELQPDNDGVGNAMGESNQILQAIVDASPMAIILTDSDGKVRAWNPAAERLFGWTAEEVLGGPVPMIPRDKRDVVQSAMSRVFSGEPITNWQARPVRKDGTRVEVVISAAPTRDAGGQRNGMLAMYADVTETKAAERSLRESEERFRTVFEKTAFGIALMDLGGHVVEANPALQRMLGYSAEELAGMTFSQYSAPEELGANLELFQQLLAGKRDSFQLEKRYIRKDGKIVWGRLTATIAANFKDGAPAVVAMVEDVTRRKQLEGQLLRAQRLEAAGRIAGQVAHDFNNLLTPLIAYPDLIKMELPEGHPGIPLCDMMQQSAAQIVDINSQLLALGRRGRVNHEPTDLNGIVEQVISHLPKVPETLRMRTEMDSDLLPVLGSSAQLLRLVTNLISNARDATDDIGQITVKTENVYLDRPLNQYNRVEMGEYVRLTVVDDGCGIAADIKDKIFDAFFSSKRVDSRRGAGLGLSVVQAIVEDHQGYVDLESTVGEGTSFYVYLPVCRQPVRQELPEELPAGDETILVVDDDPVQRDVASRTLQRLGYTAESVESGEAAIEHLRERPVDLVLLDMIMPGGIDGAETYRRILEIRPGQRAVIVSGFAETGRVQEALRLGVGQFLAKPVTLQTLAQAVRRELQHQP